MFYFLVFLPSAEMTLPLPLNRRTLATNPLPVDRTPVWDLGLRVPPTVAKLSSSSNLPLSLAALACWGFALYFPLAEVQRLGLANAGYLASIGGAFREKDNGCSA
jgi:hypothetical protein